jgi:hypothetical protein
MVLTRSELIASLQTEVRILLHLAGKVNDSSIDYRPTPKQRSTRELVRYLSFMGPTIVRYALAEPPDVSIWTEGEEAAKARSFEESVAEIGRHAEQYASLLGAVPEAKFREEFIDWEGNKTTVGSFLVNLVIGGCAAYRTQLFLYLKSAGLEHLSSANLWTGADSAPANA